MSENLIKKEIKNNVPVKNAFISVYNKAYLLNLIEGLLNYCPDITIYSSDGTYKAIANLLNPQKIQKHLKQVSEYTGQPETEGGLVKTLHHKLFLGYLTDTTLTSHQEDLKRENAVPIDLVVVNLYPFQDVISQKDCALELARKNIDVGGPSALRAGAKNFLRVMTLTEPTSYKQFIDSLRINKGATTLRQRIDATKKTFGMLSRYDGAISHYIENLDIRKALECYDIIK